MKDVITIDAINQLFVALPPVRQWTDPRYAAWYEWPLTHRGQGPYLSLRLICPVKPHKEQQLRRPFEVAIVASSGCKTERILRVLCNIQRDMWRALTVARLGSAARLMEAAPLCPNCGAATYPNSVKSTSRWFWSCSRYPTCKGMRRTQRGADGKFPKSFEELV